VRTIGLAFLTGAIISPVVRSGGAKLPSAQELTAPPAPITPHLIRTTTNAPLPLVDWPGGQGPVLSLSKGLPANVPPGTKACVAAELHYSSEGERRLFLRVCGPKAPYLSGKSISPPWQWYGRG
jgi:hypothetical protein